MPTLLERPSEDRQARGRDVAAIGDHLEATVDPDIRARQSGVVAPPGFEDAIAWVAATAPDEPPHWHVSFAVADRDHTAAEAERVGAQVLGQDDTEWTRTALIRDPGPRSSLPASSRPRRAEPAHGPGGRRH